MSISTITTSDFTVPGTQGYQQIYEVTTYDSDGVKDSKTFNKFEEAQEYVDGLQSANPSAEVVGELSPPPAAPAATPIPLDPELEDAPSWQAGADSLPPRSLADAPTGKEQYLTQLKKRAIDRRNTGDEEVVSDTTIEELRKKGVSGVFGTRRIQPKINRIKCPSEWVKQGPDNNAFIVIGNDRSGHKSTGYGGFGHTQCDSIDLAAGVGGSKPKRYDKKKKKRHFTNPNFFLDAARVYISQKTDIDNNFGIGLEANRKKADAKSGIAVKADHVRIIGRESLKLVTNTDKFNSQGGEIRSLSGIEIMANNDEEGLQPIPKGENLRNALFKLSEYVESLTKMFHAYVKYQMKYNQAVQNHQHNSPFFGKFTTKSVTLIPAGQLKSMRAAAKTEMSILKSLTNMAGYRNNFLLESGDEFINSRFNKVN